MSLFPYNDPPQMAQADIDAQWPRFTVTCKACGSTLVELENTMGFSELSGAWGGIWLNCLACGNRTEIVES